jgi:hypothetical protein
MTSQFNHHGDRHDQISLQLSDGSGLLHPTSQNFPQHCFHQHGRTQNTNNKKKQWRENFGIKSLPTDPDPDSESLLTLEEVEA